MQIFDQKTGSNHSYTIMHPSCCQHLSHSGINDRITRFASAPNFESLFGFRIGVDLQAVHFGLQILPSCLWLVKQHIGIKLAPTKFAAIVIMVLVWLKLGQQLSRVHHTEAQINRHLTAAIAIRIISFVFIFIKRSLGEISPSFP